MQHRGSRRYKINLFLLLMVLVSVLVLAACGESPGPLENFKVPRGDPGAGRAALTSYGCGTCHVIPGVPAADGMVGPPLTGWAGRQFISGKLPNNPANLIRWIQHPQAVEPGTAMPDLDVPEQAARDMAAYMYTLGGGRASFSAIGILSEWGKE